MPTDRRRVQIPVDPAAFALLGLDETLKKDVSSETLSGWLAATADLLPAVTADLARELRASDWDFLADALHYLPYPSPGLAPAHLAIAAAAERAHRERRAGDRWFITDAERGAYTSLANELRADARVKRVTDVLRGLSALHGLAVLAGVHWFWTHARELQTATGSWWLPAIRRKWYEERAALRQREREHGQPDLFSEPGE